MNRSLGTVLFLLALAAGCAPRPETPHSIAVLSFNIRYGAADDGPDRWELRRELTLRTIRDSRADIIGIQEALAFQVDEIAEAFPGYDHVGVGRNDGLRAGEFVPVFYRSDRFTEDDHGHFWLSPTPDVPGSVGWGNSITRMCTWIRLTDRWTGLTFTVFNTHWDHQSQESREAGAALIRERVARAMARPVIVTGDFNAGPSNPAFQVLTGEHVTGQEDPVVRLLDSYYMLYPHGDDLATYHAFTGARDGEKIDAVLVGPGWVVESAAIDRTDYEGRYPSDHFAVGATLSPVAEGGS